MKPAKDRDINEYSIGIFLDTDYFAQKSYTVPDNRFFAQYSLGSESIVFLKRNASQAERVYPGIKCSFF